MRRRLIALAALGALLLLTGGLGEAVPHIHGLERCGDYYSGRLLLGAAGLLVLSVAVIGCRLHGASRRPALLVGAGAALLAATCALNVALGQDPLGAWLNWRAPWLDYAPHPVGRPTERYVMIENHEAVIHDTAADVYYVSRGA